MYRIMLVFGGLAGAVAIAAMLISLSRGVHSLPLGYLILFTALSLIFVAIKLYRDRNLGGVIRFSTAFGVGIGIALVASLVYVLVWEIYLFQTDYAFFDQYARAMVEAERARGATAADLARMESDMAAWSEIYNNQLLVRIGFTLLEILPVGLLVTLVSAALLRNGRFLAARGADPAGL
jgi:hypothetical protein